MLPPRMARHGSTTRWWCLAALAVATWPALARSDGGSLTPQGFSGVIATPDASVVADGHFALSYSRLRVPGRGEPDNFVLGLGLLPFVEFSGRLAHVETNVINDLSASAKLKLPLSLAHRYLPDLAVGLQDLASASPYFRSRYLVATETVGPLRVSAGLGFGPDRLDGFFGGAELRVTSWLRLQAEHDGVWASLGAAARVPLGVGGLPVALGASVWGRAGDGVRDLDVAVSVEAPLGGTKRSPVPESGDAIESGDTINVGGPVPAQLPDAAAVSMSVVEGLLVEAGFENVRVGVKAERAAYVQLEDNRFHGNELDGLGVALGIVAIRAPRELDWIVLVQRKTGLALRELWVPRWPLVAYLEGKGGRDRLESELDVSPCLSSVADVVFAGSRQNSSYGKLRVTLAPRIQTVVGTEVTPFAYVLSAKPEVTATLWPGAVINAAWEIPLAWSQEFDDGGVFRQDRRGIHTAHALLYQGFSIAPGLMGLAGGGLFRRNKGGVLGELMWASPDGFFWLRGSGGYFRDRLDGEFSSALGSARVWLPWIDGSLEVTGGRYFFGDVGGGVELARYFGDTEVGVYYQRSDAQIAGARVALPLTPRRGMRPGRIQLRGPTRWRYDQITTVNQAANTFYPNQGILPQTSYTLRDEYLNAGRLGSDYVRAHLDRMREAYLRWGRELTPPSPPPAPPAPLPETDPSAR